MYREIRSRKKDSNLEEYCMNASSKDASSSKAIPYTGYPSFDDSFFVYNFVLNYKGFRPFYTY